MKLKRKFQIKNFRFQRSEFNVQKGFTLLEVLAAIFLITIGVVGTFTLVQKTITFTQVSSSRLTAAYLAQEGIEIVRNIRDSNFLKIHQGVGGVSWNDGLTGCSGDCEADYNDLALVPYAGRFLKIDAGFYNYDSGADTLFKRKITITPEGTDILKVLVQVQWQERGRSYEVIAQENLYNWW